MSIWRDILSAAVVGTEQVQVPPLVPGEAGELLKRADFPDKERALLSAATVLTLQRRCGLRLATATHPHLAAAEAETRPQVTQRAAAHLGQMLHGDHNELLPEWLSLVAESGQRVPPELLPLLLDHRISKRDLAVGVVGRRGEWLIAQNPDWQQISAGQELPADVWETGSLEQRSELLRQRRMGEPEAAREMLGAGLAVEKSGARVQLLQTLEVNLSPGDAPFLEEMLRDKSKEVRRTAAALLGSLPSSVYVQRMITRAELLITFKPPRLLSGGSISFELPAEDDAQLAADGLDAAAYANRAQLGKRAALLLLLLGCIPPAHWTEKFGADAATLIKLAGKTEWERPAISGWALAAIRHRDRRWAEAILRSGVPFKEIMEGGEDLILLMPETERAALLLHLIATRPAAFDLTASANEEKQVGLRMLASFQDGWPDELSRAMLPFMRKALAHEFSYMYTELLKKFVISMRPGMLDEALGQLSSVSSSRTAENLAGLISFRKEMLAALHIETTL